MRDRIFFISVGIGIFACIILLRLFFLQVTQKEQYQAQASRQQGISLLSELRRGGIFFKDSDGMLVPAAVTHRTYNLVGNPRLIENSEYLLEKLTAIVPDMRRDDLTQQLSDKERSYVLFAKNIEKETSLRITEEKLMGIWIEEEEQRIYPSSAMASQVLGFVGFDGNDRTGQYGIEQQYENALLGKSNVAEKQTFRNKILAAGQDFLPKKQSGQDVILTIDPNIQSYAEGLIKKIATQWHAKSAGVLVIQPKTGAIIAMESTPSFDPNTYGTVSEYNVFLNPIIQNLFEMGSIMKPITMAAGLDARAITEKTTYHDVGFLKIADATIKNFDGKGRGTVTMYDILDKSLNTGAVFIMRQLGMRAFRDYVERFGLGELTGIDLPHEIEGNMVNLKNGGEVEYATASFGQGIAVTPLGLTTALSAVANGGNLMRPYIVQRIMDGKKIVYEAKPTIRRRVISKEVSEIVTRMLVQVVDATLGGGKARLTGYSIAAKTGTAQIPNIHTSGYSDYYLHTFFGYGPAFDPKFFILLYLEQPTGVRYASQTLTEPFHNLSEFIVSYYKIPPDRPLHQ